MKKVAYIIIFAVAVLAVGFVEGLPVKEEIYTPGESVEATEIIDLINQYRVEQGLGELKSNPELKQAAQARAEEMILGQWFSHDRPDGTKPWGYAKEYGYKYEGLAENLALGFDSNVEVVRAWKRSSAHDAVLKNKKAEDIGVGIARGFMEGEEKRIVVIQVGRE